MSEERNEKLTDLLIKKAVSGLDESEQRELDDLDSNTVDEFSSLELTVAAISMAGVSTDEPLPAHLYSKIASDAERFVGAAEMKSSPWPPVKPREQEVESEGISWFGWLGWAAAAIACIALALNIWFTRTSPNNQANIKPPTVLPKILTPAEQREEMMRSTVEMVKANWTAGNVKEMNQITGDVIWSDEKQTGYMRLKGLPKNDGTKETYQLWIFDKTQDKATPIDGGTFDVTADGEMVIPINAKLKAKGPEMFAITIEKPGGVVVSKREKLAAIAKVGTQS
jgi:anti-sigma-K factor RskA